MISWVTSCSTSYVYSKLTAVSAELGEQNTGKMYLYFKLSFTYFRLNKEDFSKKGYDAEKKHNLVATEIILEND